MTDFDSVVTPIPLPVPPRGGVATVVDDASRSDHPLDEGPGDHESVRGARVVGDDGMATQAETLEHLTIPPPGCIDTVVVDYVGVLTNPLAEILATLVDRVGIDLGLLATALAEATARHGETPMAALQTGRISETEFARRLLAHLPASAAERLEARPLGELWFEGCRPNEPFLAFLQRLRAAGYRLALLTNTAREWEHRWRAQVPADEMFSVVVSSAQEGIRKPHPQIFERLLERLSVRAKRCLLVDDDELNCGTAAAIGMTAIPFQDTVTTATEIVGALSVDGSPRRLRVVA